MADFRVGSGPFFDKGIDSITYKTSESLQGLPDPQELSPTDNVQRPLLEQLLALPGIDAFLDDLVKPDFDDRDLLLPTRFREVMDDAMASLKQAAQDRQSSDPDAAKGLSRAIRLLNDEVSLRDLLQMYRSALYQG